MSLLAFAIAAAVRSIGWTSRIGIGKCRAPKSRPGQDNWSTVDPRF